MTHPHDAFVLGLALLVLLAASCAPAYAEPLPCALPHCAELAADEPAPFAGHLYSPRAAAEVAQLGAAARALLAELVDAQARETEAERDLTAAEADREHADATVTRCADAVAQPAPIAPSGVTEYTADPFDGLKVGVWGVAVTAVTLGAVAVLEQKTDAGAGVRYSAGAAAGLSLAAVAWLSW